MNSIGNMIEKAIAALTRALAIAGGVTLLLLAMMVVASIIGRRIGAPLGPVPGDVELVELGCALAVSAFLPWCHRQRRHVTVDWLIRDPGSGAGRVTSVLADILMAAAAALLLASVAAGFADRLASGETTFILRIPLSWAYGGCLIGLTMFLVEAVRALLRQVLGMDAAS